MLLSIKINVLKLTDLFFERIILYFNILADIVNNRIFWFINAFWLTLCYYIKIKRRFNIAFHSLNKCLNEKIKLEFEVLYTKLR